MADDVESRLQALRTKQQDAQRRHAQAEAKLDTARSQKQALLDGLKKQGFPDVKAARARVQELSAETETILAQIEEQVAGL
jgi:chromosome segregation ATPase